MDSMLEGRVREGRGGRVSAVRMCLGVAPVGEGAGEVGGESGVSGRRRGSQLTGRTLKTVWAWRARGMLAARRRW